MLKIKFYFIICILIMGCKNEFNFVLINKCSSGKILNKVDREITENIIKFETDVENEYIKYNVKCNSFNLTFDNLYKINKNKNLYIYKSDEYYLIVFKLRVNKIKHFVLKNSGIKFLGFVNSFDKNKVFYLNNGKKCSISFKENYIVLTNYEF